MKTGTKLNNETAVIIGGTGDIGHATAYLFVEAGANVVITGRAKSHTETRASVFGSNVRGIAVDPGDEAQLHALFAEIGPFEYLLLTLGTQAVTMPFTELPEEQLLRGMAAGLTRTNFWNRLGMSAEAQAAMFLDGERSIPLRHVAAPEEIARALLFAATNRYTTGTILDTNGGLHLGRVNAQSEQSSFGSKPGAHR